MPKLTKKRSQKAGLPPGTLIHIGEKKREVPKITILDYDEGQFQEREAKSVEECFPLKEKPTVTWINVEGLHQVEVLERLGGCYGLHPLVLEDILNTDQRPKMEDYGEYVYIVLKMLTYYDDKSGQIEAEQISLVLGRNFVLSFQEGKKGDVFDLLRERLRGAKGRIRKMGADYLAY
jgi:magnesium transporter